MTLGILVKAKRDPQQRREQASVRRERRAIVIGEDVGVEDATPREERPNLELGFDVCDVRNVGVGMGIYKNDW